MNSQIILFASLIVLSLVVIAYAESKQITSIYTYEGFKTNKD